MNNTLDVKKWRKFKIGNIFELSIAKSQDFGNLDVGKTPFIGRTESNNGLQGYVAANDVNTGQCISISMVGTLCALWQAHDFAASQNILLLRNNNLNKYNAFMSSVISFMLKGRYSYNRPYKNQNL